MSDADYGVWGTIGAALAAALGGGLAWIAGKGRRQAEDSGYATESARHEAEQDIIATLRVEIQRLNERVLSLEQHGERMRMRIWHLEDEMRKHSVPIPPHSAPIPPHSSSAA